MIDKFKDKEFIKNKFTKPLIFLVTFICIFGILITSRLNKTYSLKVGDIALEDIQAPREVTDTLNTEILKEQASNSVSIQYSRKTDVTAKVVTEINGLFTEAAQLKDSPVDENTKILKLKSDFPINITDEDYKKILGFSKEELNALQQFLVKTMTQLYNDYNIEEANGENATKSEESLKRGKESIKNSFNSSSETDSFSKELRNYGLKIAYAEIKPNFFYDNEATEELKKEAQKNVAPVIIKKDQTIVKKGEPVTASQLEVLNDLGLINNLGKFDYSIFAALGGLVLLILTLQWIFLYRNHRWVYKDNSKFILINVLIVTSILLARTL